MREVKFRLWDKRSKSFTDLFEKEITLDGSILEHNENAYGDLPSTDVSDDFVLCQFTGLKDKNGKEIYEGDIVRVNGHPSIGEVVFWNGRFIAKHKPLIKETLYTDMATIETTVIGNIHENPELLKS